MLSLRQNYGRPKPRIRNKLFALYQGTTSVVPPPAKKVGL
jgi:hypothetical protein